MRERSRIALLALVAGGATLGCESASRATGGESTPPPVARSPHGPAAADCPALLGSYGEAVKGATRTCTVAADCDCFEGIDYQSACGGVVDVRSATRIASIVERFHAQGCSIEADCELVRCEPSCRAGKCAR